MTYQHISRITYELGRIEGLVQGSGADEVDAISDCIDTIMDLLDTALVGETDFLVKTEAGK